jgi:hypothetical protein
MKCEMVHCCDVRAKVWGWILHIFSLVPVKCHGSMWNWLFHLSHLYQSHWVWICHSNTHLPLMLSSPNACLIIARVSITLFLTFAQHLMRTHCFFVGSVMKLHQTRYATPNERTWESQHIRPAAWNFMYWLQKYEITVQSRYGTMIPPDYRKWWILEKVGTDLLIIYNYDYHLTELIITYLFYVHKCVLWIFVY